MLRAMNRNFWIGLAMVLASYGQWLVPKDWAAENHFAAGFPLSFGVALFSFGTIFLCEGVVQKLGGASLMSLARGGGWKFVRFFVVAALVGVIVEIFAQWLGKLWYYAYYPTWFYWPSLVPSFILYWVLIVESYMAAKAVLDRLIRRGGQAEQPVRHSDFESYLFGVFGMVGAGLLMYGLVAALFGYAVHGGYYFNALSAGEYAPALRYILYCCAGLWLLGEAVLYARQATSLVHATLRGYVVPLLAILLASTVLSLVWESQNAVVDYWVYTRWPWPDMKVLDVQVSVLLTWPVHYLPFTMLAAALVPAWAPAFFERPAARPRTTVRTAPEGHDG